MTEGSGVRPSGENGGEGSRADLSATPRANRLRIAFFGLRNAGKSTLANAFTGQRMAIVSDIPGTTTDPVSKAMEILPLGPCLVTDTAGLDDVGELGFRRVERTLGILAATDIAVWVESAGDGQYRQRFLDECRRRRVTFVTYRRGDSVEALRAKIAGLGTAEATPRLLEGIVGSGDRVICVCPIDEAAPKGRLILPQVQVIRECLDVGATATVCQPRELAALLAVPARWTLVITDSQAFAAVRDVIRRSGKSGGTTLPLTSFSILYARQKGDLAAFQRGLEAVARLRDGDTVLVAEGCTHHRQCNDIGTVKIPKAVECLSGHRPRFVFASGGTFDLAEKPRLVVHCGGCMLTRREMIDRIVRASGAGIPVVNYGILLAAVQGVDGEAISIFDNRKGNVHS